MCIFSSILNCSYANQKNSIINRWKYRSKGLLKTIFFVTKEVVKMQTKSVAFGKKLRYFTDQNGPEWWNWKWILSIFKFRNECYKQVEQKKRSKNAVILVVFIFLSSVMILKLSKKVHFLNFVLNSAKKSKYVKAIYIYVSERSCYAFSENVIVYYAMT